ncbi:MAG: DNA cytosine methyltransferase [Kofleriaceae bacterium]
MGNKKKSPRPPILRAFLEDGAMIVDSFAGGGGASSGVVRAMRSLGLDKSPDIAINHDPEAIAMHKANHPETKHYIEDVWQVDPREACGDRPVALAWFSPTCTHFSKAKGTALDASSLKIRGLAWVAVRWAAAVRPRIICLENVEEFAKWGPLHRQHTDGCSEEYAIANGRKIWARADKKKGPAQPFCKKECRLHKPIKSREGDLFEAFVARLRKLGYVVEWRLLRACDYGAPTTRRRLFLVARCDGKPIAWPEPSHGPGRTTPYRTAAECIDWAIPCPSIFERDRPLADKTLARIARGIQKFVLDNPRPFIVPVAYGRDARVNSIDEPMRTICGNRGGHAVVTPVLVPATHGDTHGRPDTRTHSVEEPLRTLTPRGSQCAVVSALLLKTKTYGGGGNDAKSADEPLGTVTASKRGEFAIAVPYLVHRSNGERPEKVNTDGSVSPGQAPRVYDIEKPIGTIVAQGQKHALSVALLIKNNGGNNDRAGSAGQVVDRPIDTIACKDQKSLTVAHLVRYNGERSDSEVRGGEVSAPISTIDTSNRFGLVASHLVNLRGTSAAHIEASAHSLTEPMPTVTASGTHVAAVSAFLVRYNGTGDAERMDAPMPTQTTKPRFGLVTVTIGGEEYVVADIGMRMLTPRELYLAQGFDSDYVIECPGPTGKPLTKTAQIRMVGNSVPPVMAEVIARAQLEAA